MDTIYIKTQETLTVSEQLTRRNERIKDLMRIFDIGYATAAQVYSTLNTLRIEYEKQQQKESLGGK